MSRDTKSGKIFTVKMLALFAVILFGMTFATDWFITSTENQDFKDRYEEIEPGMPESMVVSLLGTPNNRSSEFYLGQKKEFEEAYRRAGESGATNYLIWELGTDEVYTVGFNEEGKVVIVEAGGR
ncbi:MAG: hypothetical protein DRQ65_02105 [Gammaproteobacteria bacterium]|nr:MAG: hypothetical protein DRQ98_06330 [Gammaproteobacteria bacterium]RLA57171.1 MAG: hypothetical protein DRQ65_02105 [Gammaproteobacteria bacterium]HDY83966.1 hypothetical protein [Halieaceae bacterium]